MDCRVGFIHIHPYVKVIDYGSAMVVSSTNPSYSAANSLVLEAKIVDGASIFSKELLHDALESIQKESSTVRGLQSDPPGWHTILDMTPECLDESSIHFMLLGVENKGRVAGVNSPSGDGVCLVLVSLESGVFRRVGLAFDCEEREWAGYPTKNITII
jgi:hypothetical protein